jgi:predicted nuclease of predicted toxin-antitoxin system
MRVLTDEHVSPVVANTLQSEGLDAVTIYDTPAIGKDDPAVLEFANENEAMILTNDLDFITQQFVEDADHWGILFYEDQRTPRSDIVRSVHNALSVLRPEDTRNEIVHIPDGWL